MTEAVIPLRRPAADPLDLLLSRLQGVRRHGERHVARCPAHDDKSPSLSLSRGADGRALVHCYAGCETRDVLAAVGLELRDLFPDNLSQEQRQQYRREHLTKERSFERLIIEAAKGAAAPLCDGDVARLALAQERIDQLDRELSALVESAAEDQQVPDPIADALAKVKQDPGAIFEPGVLTALRQVRENDPARWARIRHAVKEAKTVSLADLDKLTSTSNEAEVGTDDLFPEVTLWPDPVDGAELLEALADAIRRHVIADPATVHAAALWAVFTWFADVVNVAPIANITAPEKRCGKTVMLGVLARLACRPLAVSNIAPAALFRALELWAPTLLIDEVDAFLAEHEEARGILNAGFTRDTAFVIRCVGDDHLPTRFNVWGAKALCGIGKIADTLADRSIPLRLRRKLPGERTVKIRHADPAAFAELVGKLARFAIDNREAIRTARPAEVDGLNDRANDCWEPLLSVAEVAGGNWPRLARMAAAILHGLEEDTPSIGAELLASIRDAFDNRRADRLSTADLLEALAEDEEAPWAAWNRGKPMTPHQLAKRLAEFGIKPTTQRIGYKAAKGYKREQFAEAFKRYLSASPPETSVTPLQPSNHAASSDFGNVTRGLPVTDENGLKASNHAACNGVTDLQGVTGEDKAEYF